MSRAKSIRARVALASLVATAAVAQPATLVVESQAWFTGLTIDGRPHVDCAAPTRCEVNGLSGGPHRLEVRSGLLGETLLASGTVTLAPGSSTTVAIHDGALVLQATTTDARAALGTVEFVGDDGVWFTVWVDGRQRLTHSGPEGHRSRLELPVGPHRLVVKDFMGRETWAQGFVEVRVGQRTLLAVAPHRVEGLSVGPSTVRTSRSCEARYTCRHGLSCTCGEGPRKGERCCSSEDPRCGGSERCERACGCD